MVDMTTLYYVHDPMCSWCWAYRPVMLELREQLPDSVRWQNVLGGLAPDTDEPMGEQIREMVQGHWRNIQATIGTEFNFDFWTKCQPRRDTYKACRAVISASNQGAGEEMILAIQEAYYLRALNPSEPDTLIGLAGELGLDQSCFSRDLVSGQTEAELQRQFQLRQELQVRSFPSLVLYLDSSSSQVSISHHYDSYRLSLEAVHAALK